MSGLILRNSERITMQELIGCTMAARSLRRAYALLWSDEDKAYPEIAGQLNVSRQTVYNWVDRFHERVGSDMLTRLAHAPRAGRPETAPGIIDPFIEAALKTEPRDWGYRATVWTTPLLTNYLTKVHHLVVSCAFCHVLHQTSMRWNNSGDRPNLKAWRIARPVRSANRLWPSANTLST
jgi:transposase